MRQFTQFAFSVAHQYFSSYFRHIFPSRRKMGLGRDCLFVGYTNFSDKEAALDFYI